MNGVTKFVIGAAVTSFMAMASHAGLGHGFIDGLGSEADRVVADSGIAGVSADMVTEPMLERTVVLSGDASPEDRARLEAALRAIPGIGAVRWAQTSNSTSGDSSASAPAATGPAAEPTPAQTAAVQDCQADLNAAGATQTIEFNTGQASLRPQAGALISSLAHALAACDNVRIEVAGHTDAVGDAAANQTLSEARARTVVAALVAQGAPEDRLTSAGYGETRPVAGAADGNDPRNRRIEFVVSQG